MNIDEFLGTIIPLISTNIATIIGCVVLIIKAVKSIKGSVDSNTEEVKTQNALLSKECKKLHRENAELKRQLRIESYKRLNIKETKKDDLHEED